MFIVCTEYTEHKPTAHFTTASVDAVFYLVPGHTLYCV